MLASTDYLGSLDLALCRFGIHGWAFVVVITDTMPYINQIDALLINGFFHRAVFMTHCESFGLDYKQYSVPVSVAYSAHRLGELCMLLLGETILSLVPLGIQKETFYIMFVCGIWIAGNL